MEIILSNHCKSLTGSLGQGFGYFIVNRKGRFYSVRSKHSVPHDGHWRFILTCADLAQNGLHIADIRVPGWEIFQALEEAGFNTDNFNGSVSTLYNAQDVLTLKERISL